MHIRIFLATAALMTFSGIVWADLAPYKDYDVSDSVWSVTTIRVNANMGDTYLEGLRDTWVASAKLAVKLGHMKSWSIYRSDLPQSGDFNLLLVTEFANTADMAPNRERYDAFMKEWGEARNKKTNEYAQKNYPGMRTITGQYVMRKISLK